MNFRLSFTAGTGLSADGRPLSAFVEAAGIRKARRLIAEAFGGYTETETAGGWVDDEGKLVEEGGRRWITVCSGDELELFKKGEEIAAEIAAALQQQCVVLELERLLVTAFVAAKAPAAAEVAA